MATIANLDIKLGADASDLTRGLTRGTADLQRFAQAAESAIATLPGLDVSQFFAGLQQGATDALRELGLLDRQADAVTASLAGIAPAVAPVAPAMAKVASATDTLLSKLGLVRRTADGLGNVLQVPNTAASAEQVSILAGALQQVPAVAGSAEAATQRLAAGFAQAGADAAILSRGTREALEGAAKMAAGITAAGTATRQGTTAFDGHARSATLARTALLSLASQALGTTGAVGRLAESVLFASQAAGAVALAAGTVLGLVKAYEFLATAETKAREEQDKLVTALLAEADNAIPAAVRATTALAAAIEATNRAREKSRFLGALGAAANLTPFGGGAAPFVAEAQRQQSTQIQNDLRAQRQAQDDVTKGVRDFEDANVQALTESIRLGAADAFQRQQAAGFVAILAARTKDHTRTITEQGAAVKLLGDLMDALAQKSADAARGDALVRGLAVQVATFGQSEVAAKKLAIAMDATLTPAQRRAATALLTTLDGLQRQKQAAEDAAKASEQAGISIKQAFEDAIQVVQEATAALADDPFAKLIATQAQRTRDALGQIPAPTSGISDEFERASQAAGDLNQQLTRSASASNDFFRHAAEGSTSLTDSIHGVTHGLDQIVGASRNIGLIGDEAANAINGVLNLADAVGNLFSEAAGGLSTGNILSVIGAGVGALGSLLGPSPAEQEHLRRLQDNTRAIEHNTVVQGRQGQALTSAAVNAGIDAALNALNNQPLGPKGTPRNPDQTGLVNKALEKFGLDLVDLQEIASRNHISLIDSQGRIDLDALKQFNDAVDSGKISLLGLGDAADAATASLLNVPEGFKIARARFQAQDFADVGALGPIGDPGSLDGRAPTVHTGPSFSNNTFVFNIDGAGKNGAQVGREALNYFQTQAMATRGRTVDWAEVNV